MKGLLILHPFPVSPWCSCYIPLKVFSLCHSYNYQFRSMITCICYQNRYATHLKGYTEPKYLDITNTSSVVNNGFTLSFYFIWLILSRRFSRSYSISSWNRKTHCFAQLLKNTRVIPVPEKKIQIAMDKEKTILKIWFLDICTTSHRNPRKKG